MNPKEDLPRLSCPLCQTRMIWKPEGTGLAMKADAVCARTTCRFMFSFDVDGLLALMEEKWNTSE